MSAVSLEYKNKLFVLEVPGLAEKRPSLLRGMTLKKILFDRVYIFLTLSFQKGNILLIFQVTKFSCSRRTIKNSFLSA